MKTKLTVGIPTYNRKKALKKQVEWFISQGILEYDNVEFIISDNASTDGTSEYLETLCKLYPKIHVNINKQNIGACLNIGKITELANGEYIWFVGDDDDIHNGIIDNILSILNSNLDLAWLFIKFNFMTNDGLVEYELDYKKKYINGIDLFKKIAYSNYRFGGGMFITASVHRRENVIKVMDWFKNSDESLKYDNRAIPLGLSFYSSLSGSAMTTDFIGITDNIVDVAWRDKIVKIFCRDQIAILDNIAKMKKCKLLNVLSLKNGLDNKYPEWTYIRGGYKENNYAFWFYLKNKPTQIVYDLFELIINKIKRKLRRTK